jgi:hypothetical protein
MKVNSFDYLNREFWKRVEDVRHLDSGPWNFLKVAQHAITHALNEVNDYSRRHYFERPFPFLVIYYFARVFFRGKNEIRSSKNDIIFFEQTRFVKTEKGVVSHFFHSFYATLPRPAFFVVTKKEFVATELSDLGISPDSYSKLAFGKSCVSVLYHAYRFYHSIKKSKVLNDYELSHLGCKLDCFMMDFVLYNDIFRRSTSKMCCFTDHYFNEGLIAAAKVNNIKTVEMQHGLISEHDLYYVYPREVAVISMKAMFPDYILVFGEYWKKTLLKGSEFLDSQILIAGDYQYKSNTPKNTAGSEKENLILVCTQKFLEESYVPYIDNLLKTIETKHTDWRVAIKLHPFEFAKEAYDKYRANPLCEVHESPEVLYSLFRRAKIQISIYSTTFFDAVGYGLVNFSIQDFGPFGNYAREMAESGVAQGIKFEEDPVEVMKKLIPGRAGISREKLYADFKVPELFS